MPLEESISALLEQGNGCLIEPVPAGPFVDWAKYTGMALEDCNRKEQPHDWLHEGGRIRDLTFRCLLILSNFGLLA